MVCRTDPFQDVLSFLVFLVFDKLAHISSCYLVADGVKQRDLGNDSATDVPDIVTFPLQPFPEPLANATLADISYLAILVQGLLELSKQVVTGFGGLHQPLALSVGELNALDLRILDSDRQAPDIVRYGLELIWSIDEPLPDPGRELEQGHEITDT
ncbi:hypothetical protein NKR23_g4970 [Pleurostoma richardsiae]|uniref:Uncharacterized protein n=1 Tax=Pleurostoma richardsiae TaxID=41990 RepID=A0AA38RUH1_9PEZI|nr:hypothetical protein NKR23_g4970 [Pleurostoma richardsiae]